MKPVIRYQSQLLFRKSYKPNRLIRNPTGGEAEHHFSSDATVRFETAT